MKLNAKKAKKIAGDAKKTAEAAELVYIQENSLNICRKRHGRGFMYFKENKKITNPNQLKRFKALVIPPAWKDVKISPLPNSHLQVIGKDNKGRKQYRYHPLWNKVRNSTKFFRMQAFGEALPQIRNQVSKDLNQQKMTQTKCLALVIRLMEETHIRIGGTHYAKENESYGLSTLRDKHVKELKTEIKFEFTGKKGIKHSVGLKDKKLQKLVLQCEEIPGWELFQYYDEDGQHHHIDSGMVNNYIKEIAGKNFTAKDFRTWSASKIFLKKITTSELPETEKEREKNVREACSFSAEKLRNTRSVCRNYYIHPALIQKYLNGSLTDEIQKSKPISTIQKLDKTENLLLQLIKDYSFKIEE